LFQTVIETFGMPLSMYTDNGAHFTSEDFYGMVANMGIKHCPAPKTHPSSVDLAEKYVQLLMGILKRRVQGGDKRLWDTLIPSATRTLNTCGIRVHGYTPSELLLGNNPWSGPADDITAHQILDGLDEKAHGLHLVQIDGRRAEAGEKIIAAATFMEDNHTEKKRRGV
jgi:hypothetical protein